MTVAGQWNFEFFALVARYCALGRLLPTAEDIDIDDDLELAEVKMVLAEMNKTKSEMKALLTLASSSNRSTL